MRAAAIALTLLVASTALADRDRDNDPIVLNERRINERLDQLEKLLEKIEKEKNRRDRTRLVTKALEEIDDLRKTVRRAPELDQRPQHPQHPAPPRPPAGQPQSPPVVVRPPPAPVVYPMTDAALQDLMGAMRRQSFSRDQLGVLQQATPHNYFLVAQAQQVLGLFSFSGDRLSAMRQLKPRLLDRENFYKLYDSFTFSSEKEELRKILEL